MCMNFGEFSFLTNLQCSVYGGGGGGGEVGVLSKLYSGKDKAVKGEGWAPPFICCTLVTVDP